MTAVQRAFAQGAIAVVGVLGAGALHAQTAGSAEAPPTLAATVGGASARFLESCQQALQHGRVDPACEGAAYRSELDRLRAEALRTNSPSLLGLMGDAYTNPGSGMAEPAEAYRWYLMAAVRGDARAMERLTDMYRHGQGVARDRVRAFGYARATTRLAVPGSASAQRAESTLQELGAELSAQELALAERFAEQMVSRVARASGDAPSGLISSPEHEPPPRDRSGVRPWNDAQIVTVPRGPGPGPRAPGMGAAQSGGAPHDPTAISPGPDTALQPGRSLPGQPLPRPPVPPAAPPATSTPPTSGG